MAQRPGPIPSTQAVKCTNSELGSPGSRAGLPDLERVVDRVPRALIAFCAFRAFGQAFSAAGALRAGRRGHGKEAVYGSIP